jgi:hypothetical protein
MKYLKSTIPLVVAVLGWTAVDARAAGKANPYETTIESPFKGVVVNLSQTTVTVKGETKFKNPAAGNPANGDTRGKPPQQPFHFLVKGVDITRDGKKCEMKDVQKGDGAVVEFTTKLGSEKRYVTKVNFTSGGLSGDDKKAGDKK